MAMSEPVDGFVCDPLFEDAVIAVCAPAFADLHGLVGAPQQLRDPSIEILRDGGQDRSLDWANWLPPAAYPSAPRAWACGSAIKPCCSKPLLRVTGCHWCAVR